MTCATDNGRILCVMIYNIAAHMKKEGIFFFVETAQATCVFCWFFFHFAKLLSSVC